MWGSTSRMLKKPASIRRSFRERPFTFYISLFTNDNDGLFEHPE